MSPALGDKFTTTFNERKAEADAFYAAAIPARLTAEETNVARQGLASLLWTKQFYHYVVKDWLEGDPEQPPPPRERLQGRNGDWLHLFNRDVISMPDKWEYPWVRLEGRVGDGEGSGGLREGKKRGCDGRKGEGITGNGRGEI